MTKKIDRNKSLGCLGDDIQVGYHNNHHHYLLNTHTHTYIQNLKIENGREKKNGHHHREQREKKLATILHTHGNDVRHRPHHQMGKKITENTHTLFLAHCTQRQTHEYCILAHHSNG